MTAFEKRSVPPNMAGEETLQVLAPPTKNLDQHVIVLKKGDSSSNVKTMAGHSAILQQFVFVFFNWLPGRTDTSPAPHSAR